MDGAGDAGPAKAPRPFLRRGEGVEKRVFASKYRKPTTPGASGSGRSSAGGDAGFSGEGLAAECSDVPGRVDQAGRPAPVTHSPAEDKAWPGYQQQQHMEGFAHGGTEHTGGSACRASHQGTRVTLDWSRRKSHPACQLGHHLTMSLCFPYSLQA